ncbi:MAG: hypothetical protein WC154_03145, partial [Candidatus Izemoplasmatales bacterium]
AEDNLTEIRKTVGVDSTSFEYIVFDELDQIFIALNTLGITDPSTYDGKVDLSILSDSENRSKVLESSIIQATISKQIIDLDVSDTLVVPYLEDDNISLIRRTVGLIGFETEYVVFDELDKVFLALNTLGITDVSTYNGKVDLSILSDNQKRSDVLSSSVIQATISDQLFDLETKNIVRVPYMDEDEVKTIRKTVGVLSEENNYIIYSELDYLIVALIMLGITDVTTFDGEIDLTLFYDEINRNTLLDSTIMQATISKQVFDLGSSKMIVPTYDIDNIQVRKIVSNVDGSTEYILKNEIHALFEVLELLEMDSINDFNGTVTLTKFFESQDVNYLDNQETLLRSGSIHATITDQIDSLGSDIIAIPVKSFDNAPVDVTVSGNYFIYKNEITALINALDILSINDINSFNGTVDLTPLFDSPTNPNYRDNQEKMLSSSLMHKTITNQIIGVGSSTLKVPSIGFDGVTQVDKLVSGEYFITKDEIYALIDALDILGINDITGFSGTVQIGLLSNDADQNKVLISEIIHATISMNLLDLNDSVLIVPTYSSLG